MLRRNGRSAALGALKEITRTKEMELMAKGQGQLKCTITTKEGVKGYYGDDGSCGLSTE